MAIDFDHSNEECCGEAGDRESWYVCLVSLVLDINFFSSWKCYPGRIWRLHHLCRILNIGRLDILCRHPLCMVINLRLIPMNFWSKTLEMRQFILLGYRLPMSLTASKNPKEKHGSPTFQPANWELNKWATPLFMPKMNSEMKQWDAEERFWLHR